MVDIQRIKRRQQERAQGHSIEKVQREKDLAELNKYLLLPEQHGTEEEHAHYNPRLPIINVTGMDDTFKNIDMFDDLTAFNIKAPFYDFHLYWVWEGKPPFLVEVNGLDEGYEDHEDIPASCYLWWWHKPGAKGIYSFIYFSIYYHKHEDGSLTYKKSYIKPFATSFGFKEGWQIGRDVVQQVVKSLGYLNLSNVELVDNLPSPRLAEIHKREFGKPITIYKVAKVNTSKQEYRGAQQETGLQDFDPRRMHVVRGHHAEYGTNGRGLHFGKYERKIWIPAHVRGNEELGIVVKDYEVVNKPDFVIEDDPVRKAEFWSKGIMTVSSNRENHAT